MGSFGVEEMGSRESSVDEEDAVDVEDVDGAVELLTGCVAAQGHLVVVDDDGHHVEDDGDDDGHHVEDDGDDDGAQGHGVVVDVVDVVEDDDGAQGHGVVVEVVEDDDDPHSHDCVEVLVL